MQIINQLLRGVVIGVANIIPGVSGGTMMVSMGVYDTLIHCITHLFKEFKKSILTLLPYLIGMLVGIVALASLLKYLFANYPLPTNTAFIGLILGGLSPLFAKIERKKIDWRAVLGFLVCFALIIVMSVTGDKTNPDTIDMNVLQVVVLVVMGAVASATMIIPGVSGSMMLMLLGYYHPVLNALDMLKTALFSLDFRTLGYPVLVLLPFAIGIILGIYGVAKLIEWLTRRFATITYCSVLGLVLASPVAILMNADNWNTLNAVTVIVSVVTLAAGFFAAYMLAKHSKADA